MNKFEATLLINPDLSNQIVNKELDSFKSQVTNVKGKIVSNEDWGLRDLKYNINNYKKAFYHFFQLEMNGSDITSIQNNLNQNEKIIRYLFIKVDIHQELPTKMINEEK